ncbi:putative membrane protein [Lysobacter dokdonensis DS-58]|uniref:Putative membrane protein n=1 Tax=Lysobacter dokdonensis DS-58 TaxID=1300345 RepID=A0A0A2WIZ6_9GAMM|nr:DUF6776 family protein [Lysobacter dokdonensis]KGQ18220.1 putative membrane protein [Lysobacter dokdonensis DS-58]
MEPTPNRPKFEIVPREGRGRVPAWGWPAGALVVGLLLGGGLAWWLARPDSGSPEARIADSDRRLKTTQAQVAELEQRVSTLTRSDQISRDANRDVQAMLADKDEQIASLRADVAFYERFVGSGAERKGLTVHSAEFAREAGGSWRYQVVLTQSLNRGAVSQGEMRFDVEGVREGRLTTVKWDEMQQKPGAPGQQYEFRYFQRLGGSIVLPAGFTPQRVKVALRGKGANVDTALAWTSMAIPGE